MKIMINIIRSSSLLCSPDHPFNDDDEDDENDQDNKENDCCAAQAILLVQPMINNDDRNVTTIGGYLKRECIAVSCSIVICVSLKIIFDHHESIS